MKFNELKTVLKLLFPECKVQGIPGVLTCSSDSILFDIFAKDSLADNPITHADLYIYNGFEDVFNRLKGLSKVTRIDNFIYYMEFKEE